MDYNLDLDLEEAIFHCWNIVDELKSTICMMDEHPGAAEEAIDSVSNVLIGLYTLYDHKFKLLFNAYEQFLRDNRV